MGESGADVVVNPTREDALEIVRGLTDGLGADVALEAVGTPEAIAAETRSATGQYLAPLLTHPSRSKLGAAPEEIELTANEAAFKRRRYQREAV